MATKFKLTKRQANLKLIQRSRRASPAAKAAWNHTSRRFFGLSPREIKELSEFAGARIRANLVEG